MIPRLFLLDTHCVRGCALRSLGHSSSASSTQRRAAALAMAMESAGPSAKKMKLAPTSIHEAAPSRSASESIDPQPTTIPEIRSQEQPPEAEEDGGEDSPDRISELPDAVLGEIIYLLPTKDGARTQALASRWRHLWYAAPLNLDYRGLPADDDSVLPGVILSSHEGPIHRLCLPARVLQYGANVVETWLRSPALDKLEALEFYRELRNGIPVPSLVPLQSTPPSVFRFSSTLRVATISQCHLPDDMVQTLRFPQLRKLALVEVEISEGSLQSIITSGCPGLECLLLRTRFEFRGLRINSPTLKSIGIHSSFVELIIEDAPSLQRLLYLRMHMEMQVSVISAPQLETLGYISEYTNNCSMKFSSMVIQGLRIDNLATVVRSVKILAIMMRYFDLDMVIDFMRCFPCLEKLYMKRSQSGEKNLWRRKHRNLLTSLDIRLKTVVLGFYRAIRAQVSFATFFVLNARMLESITLEVASEDYSEDFFAEQHRLLEMEKRVSRGAQLCFSKSCYVPGIEHVSDLDLTDPFACGC